MDEIHRILEENDVAAARSILEAPGMAHHLNNACLAFGMPPLAAARSRDMAALMLEHGADLQRVSDWWAPGFWLDLVEPDVAAYLVERGAALSPHAAAGLDMVDSLRTMLDGDPSLVHAKGGDGARPLHFARTVEVAQLLVERGAELNPLDDDHRSTPAHWRIGASPDVVRFLLDAGAKLDIFLAVGLDDLETVAKALHADPKGTSYRIGNNLGPFPGIGFGGTGGTILQWNLGFNASPHEIALHRGRRDIYEYLLERTEPKPKLMTACMTGDEALAQSIVEEHPDIFETFDEDDRSLLARACWETNANTEAVRIMLAVGFPADVPERNHGHSPLHNAAWDGNTPLVDLLIRHGHPIDTPDPQHNSPPLGWCIHAATEGRCTTRDYAGTAERLLEAGATFDRSRYPTNHAAIDAVLAKRCAL